MFKGLTRGKNNHHNADNVQMCEQPICSLTQNTYTLTNKQLLKQALCIQTLTYKAQHI